MRAPPPAQAIYLSKGEQDFGPYSLDELVERMKKGEFAAGDLSWHQGVSNWMALEQLPEWPTISEKIEKAKKDQADSSAKSLKPKAPPPPTASGPSLFDEVAKQGTVKGGNEFEDSAKPKEHSAISSQGGEENTQSSGVLNKILVGMAVLFFVATVGFAGFVLYKKWDELGF